MTEKELRTLFYHFRKNNTDKYIQDFIPNFTSIANIDRYRIGRWVVHGGNRVCIDYGNKFQYDLFYLTGGVLKSNIGLNLDLLFLAILTDGKEDMI